MIAGMTYYEIAWYFLIYSFIGWVIEVAYHGVTLGKVINRGFLNGPVCPVYGFGMMAVLALGNIAEPRLANVNNFTMQGEDTCSTLILFFGGMILTTAIELVAGWALDVLFHTRWWDYSNVPLNFKGYICLKFSLIWGLGVVIAVRVAHPILSGTTIGLIPEGIGWILLAVFYGLYIVDIVITVAVIIGMNKKLTELDKLRESMRVVSDELSEVVGTASIQAKQDLDERKEKAAGARVEFRAQVEEAYAEAGRRVDNMRSEAYKQVEDIRTEAEKRIGGVRAEVEGACEEAGRRVEETRAEAQRKAEELSQYLTRKYSVSGRLMKAFPDMSSRDHDEALSDLKVKVHKR